MASNKKTFNIHFSTNNPSNNDHYQHNNQKEDDSKTFMKKKKRASKYIPSSALSSFIFLPTKVISLILLWCAS